MIFSKIVTIFLILLTIQAFGKVLNLRHRRDSQFFYTSVNCGINLNF